MNIWVFVVIQAIISAVITFAIIVFILASDMATGLSFIWAFLIGQGLSVPAAWLVCQRMDEE